VDDWKKVIWSDECAVQKEDSTTQNWVFRRQNKDEIYDPRRIRMKSKNGMISQMIWACFLADKLGPIVFVEGGIKQDVYIGMLDQYFVPFLHALNADGQTNLEFQQDNASAHTAKRTKEWLRAMAEQNNLRLMEWPPNSPDMNPLENLWAHMKLELHRQYPDTASLKGSPETIKAALRPRLQEIWWNIGNDVLMNLVESMPCRVQALIHAKGWYIEY